MMILKKECPSEYADFTKCMKANDNDEAKCVDARNKLNECGSTAFKKANATEGYTF